MPIVKSSINGMLDAFSVELPVDRLGKPTVLSGIGSILQPTVTFDPAPLAAKIIRIEMFALTVTLVGAEDSIDFTSGLAVPRGEVHRYYEIGFSQDSLAAELMHLLTRYQLGGTGPVFASQIIARRSAPPGLRVNMLMDTSDSATSADGNYVGVPLDLYPGGSWQILNANAVANLTTFTLQGQRWILRGPDLIAPADVSSEFTGAGS